MASDYELRSEAVNEASTQSSRCAALTPHAGTASRPSAVPAWSASVTAARSCCCDTLVPGSASSTKRPRRCCWCSTARLIFLPGKTQCVESPPDASPAHVAVALDDRADLVGERRLEPAAPQSEHVLQLAATAATTSSRRRPDASISAIAWMRSRSSLICETRPAVLAIARRELSDDQAADQEQHGRLDIPALEMVREPYGWVKKSSKLSAAETAAIDRRQSGCRLPRPAKRATARPSATVASGSLTAERQKAQGKATGQQRHGQRRDGWLARATASGASLRRTRPRAEAPAMGSGDSPVPSDPSVAALTVNERQRAGRIGIPGGRPSPPPRDAPDHPRA